MAAVKRSTEVRLTELQQVVDHVPLEISRHIFFAISYGCKVKGEVVNGSSYRSPLTQGGLEIKCKVTIEWQDKDKFMFLK